jgi:hypothetical protein
LDGDGLVAYPVEATICAVLVVVTVGVDVAFLAHAVEAGALDARVDARRAILHWRVDAHAILWIADIYGAEWIAVIADNPFTEVGPTGSPGATGPT